MIIKNVILITLIFILLPIFNLIIFCQVNTYKNGGYRNSVDFNNQKPSYLYEIVN